MTSLVAIADAFARRFSPAAPRANRALSLSNISPSDQPSSKRHKNKTSFKYNPLQFATCKKECDHCRNTRPSSSESPSRRIIHCYYRVTTFTVAVCFVGFFKLDPTQRPSPERFIMVEGRRTKVRCKLQTAEQRENCRKAPGAVRIVQLRVMSSIHIYLSTTSSSICRTRLTALSESLIS